MSSYRKVNYSLRPAKHAHRRMMAEILSCLYPFQPVRDYQYIGFGSLWFEDFKLFHRSLGLKKMVSMERSGAHQRFLANRPFQTVEMLFGESNAKLQEVKWDTPSILWLDYDSALSTSMLLDLETAISKMASGSLLAITLNVEEADELKETLDDGEETDVALNRFRSRFDDYFGSKIFTDDLQGVPFNSLSYEIVAAKIEKILAVRNVGKADEGQKFVCQKVCQFNYADGHSMATFVFLFHENQHQEKFDQCRFDTLDFLSGLGETIKVLMPVMTLKEIREVESQLPTNDVATIVTQGVPQSDVTKFARIYRYLPNFAVLEG